MLGFQVKDKNSLDQDKNKEKEWDIGSFKTGDRSCSRVILQCEGREKSRILRVWPSSQGTVMVAFMERSKKTGLGLRETVKSLTMDQLRLLFLLRWPKWRY